MFSEKPNKITKQVNKWHERRMSQHVLFVVHMARPIVLAQCYRNVDWEQLNNKISTRQFLFKDNWDVWFSNLTIYETTKKNSHFALIWNAMQIANTVNEPASLQFISQMLEAIPVAIIVLFLSNFLTSNAENFLTVNRRFCARLVSHAVDSMSSWSYAHALIYSHRLDKYKFVAWDIQEKLEPNEHMFSTNALKWSETRLRRKQTIVCIFFGHLALQCI